MAKVEVPCTINGRPVTLTGFPMARLLDVLREGAGGVGLIGTKEGCGEGECGACSIFVDGELVNSCLIPLLQVEGSEITTIEGVADGGELHPLQQAFIDNNAAQCGICTPGMIMASLALLNKTPAPTRDQIREGLGGNLCRCTGYMKIFDAVEQAAAKLREGL